MARILLAQKIPLHPRDLCFVTRPLAGMTDLETTHTPQKPSPLTRRSALRLLALTGASLVAGTGHSQAFFDFLSSYSASPEILKELQIPSEWAAALGPQLPAYASFLQKMSLHSMTVRQLIEPHANVHGYVHNCLPPRAMWGNIKSTLKVVDSLSSRLHLPVKQVISVYRSPAYNATCPGAKSSSYHMRNNAMDVIYACPPGKVAAMARAMRATGLYKGGVGRYAGFTHLDTRGNNADW